MKLSYEVCTINRKKMLVCCNDYDKPILCWLILFFAKGVAKALCNYFNFRITNLVFTKYMAANSRGVA